MNAVMMKGENGSMTFCATYEGNAFNVVIDDSLGAHCVNHAQVSVIGIPTGSKLLKTMRGGKKGYNCGAFISEIHQMQG